MSDTILTNDEKAAIFDTLVESVERLEDGSIAVTLKEHKKLTFPNFKEE